MPATAATAARSGWLSTSRSMNWMARAMASCFDMSDLIGRSAQSRPARRAAPPASCALPQPCPAAALLAWQAPAATVWRIMDGWDAERYATNARFVSDLGLPVVALLDPKPGERILDL